MVDARDSGELVFALIAPVGTDYRLVADHLRSQLFSFRYNSKIIQLSSAIETYSKQLAVQPELQSANEYVRIKSHMRGANALYRRFNEVCDREEENALFALHAISEINEQRIAKDEKRPLLGHAHIILTLKRPQEVTYLRRVYGQGLQVISVFSPEEERIKFLRYKKHLTEDEAKDLVTQDENDNQDGGQRTGAAFHLADLFVEVGEGARIAWEPQIDRYLDLLFSHPFRTPSKDEQAMFMAHGASLRSAQLGRQVGAAIANDRGDILSVGSNDVPSPGGGLYWEGAVGDRRDHVVGTDSNDEEKIRIADEVVKLLPQKAADEQQFRSALRKSSLFGITEFGRAVHAEMEALSSCARRGVSTQDTILYSTTFPCHNCARHIIGFGVKRVVYIEPYPKSKATQLHEDAITSFASDRASGAEYQVQFTPFVGISPRRYADLFTVTPLYGREVIRKSKTTGNVIEWRREDSELRVQMYPVSYIERESLAVTALGRQLTQRTLPFGESNVEGENANGNSSGEL
jgi:deoxycytidylate deaminase